MRCREKRKVGRSGMVREGGGSSGIASEEGVFGGSEGGRKPC